MTPTSHGYYSETPVQYRAVTAFRKRILSRGVARTVLMDFFAGVSKWRPFDWR